MTLSIVTTLLVAVAAAAFLSGVVVTRLYAADPPRGINALSSFLLMVALAIAAALLLVAAATCAARGGLTWVAPRTPIAAGLALVVTLGIAAGATAMVWVWSEWRPPYIVPAGVVSGLLAPAALIVVLLICAWTSADASAKPLRLAGLALCLGALVGYAWAIAVVGVAVRDHHAHADRQVAEDKAFEREIQRRAALPLLDRMREDFAEMHEAAPLFLFVARLPEAQDDATRQFIIARAMKAPDFDAVLPVTATDVSPRDRHGAIDLIRFAPATRPEWQAIVARSIDVTVREMAAHPTWLTGADGLPNPLPSTHVESLVEAARRVAPDGGLQAAIDSLRAAIERLPESDARMAALQRFPG